MQFLCRSLERLPEEVDLHGAAVVKAALTRATIEHLLREAASYTWTKAEAAHGKADQDYWVLKSLSDRSYYRAIAYAMSAWVNMTFRGKLCGESIHFNHQRVQRYEPHSRGISPHRDGKSCKRLIALFLLEEGGRFGTCDDRTAERKPVNPKYIDMKVGDLLLMRAAGYAGKNAEPMHFVDDIRSRRITYALRYV